MVNYLIQFLVTRHYSALCLHYNIYKIDAGSEIGNQYWRPFVFYTCLYTCNLRCSSKQIYAKSCSLFPTELSNLNCEWSYAEQLQLRYHFTSQLQLQAQLHPTSSQQLQVQLQMIGFSQAQLQVQLQIMGYSQEQLQSQLQMLGYS